MNNNEIINICRQKILDNLKNEISNSYALFDLPFHTNIGDALIWEGEHQFLNEIKSKCIFKCSYFTLEFPTLNESTTILFHGGGNLGDLYREHTETLLKIIAHYPNNKIIIFPQTFFYKNVELLKEDTKKINQHKNIIICTRDKNSFNALSCYLKKEQLKLVPDMAFYISRNTINPRTKCIYKSILIKRNDNELSNKINIYIKNCETKDWPTFEHKIFDGTFIFKCLSKATKVFNNKYSKRLLNAYADIFRKQLIQIGYDFINKYQGPIYTTRLHGCILSILMDKKVYLIDNSYGKNSNFYNTWLTDLDTVQPYKNRTTNL